MSKMYNILMKKMLIALGILAAMTCGAARPYSPRPHYVPVPHRMHHPMPPPRPTPPHRHHLWGKGGSHFLPSFTGSLIGSLVAPMVVPPPPPPPPLRPIVYANQTWVPPVYETRPVYDVYGNIVRYEQVVVVPGYWR